MGIYLSTPKTEKSSKDGQNDRLHFGLSSMQGWRTSMEDALALIRKAGSMLGKLCGRKLDDVVESIILNCHDQGSQSAYNFVQELDGEIHVGIIITSEANCLSFIRKHAALPDLDASTSFFGVYDGHGGKVVSKFCAKYLHTQVVKNDAYSSGDIATSLEKTFFRIDEMMQGQRGWRELSVLGDKINKFTGMIEGLIWSPRGNDSNNQEDDWAFEEGPHSDFSGPTAGCTACVAVIRNNQLVVANAGDSRCVISRKGQAFNLSRDHKPELEVERERILKAGGFIHAGRVNGSLNLARAIGDMEFKQNKLLPPDKQIVTANPDITAVDLCDDDEFIVLACDGIWDCMSSQQLVDFIHEHLKMENSLSAVCEKVLDRCLAPSTIGGEGCDNMTMILVQFNKPMSLEAEQSTTRSTSESDAKANSNANSDAVSNVNADANTIADSDGDANNNPDADGDAEQVGTLNETR